MPNAVESLPEPSHGYFDTRIYGPLFLVDRPAPGVAWVRLPDGHTYLISDQYILHAMEPGGWIYADGPAVRVQ